MQPHGVTHSFIHSSVAHKHARNGHALCNTKLNTLVAQSRHFSQVPEVSLRPFLLRSSLSPSCTCLRLPCTRTVRTNPFLLCHWLDVECGALRGWTTRRCTRSTQGVEGGRGEALRPLLGGDVSPPVTYGHTLHHQAGVCLLLSLRVCGVVFFVAVLVMPSCGMHSRDDFNGYGYFYVRVYCTCLGFQANIVEEHVLLSALQHIFAGLKRTRDQKLSSGLLLTFMSTHIFQFRL